MAREELMNGHDQLPNWGFALAVGASSAFDITGARTLGSDLLGADRSSRTDARGRVAGDFARVMRSFGRSARLAARSPMIGKGEKRLPGSD